MSHANLSILPKLIELVANCKELHKLESYLAKILCNEFMHPLKCVYSIKIMMQNARLMSTIIHNTVLVQNNIYIIYKIFMPGTKLKPFSHFNEHAYR